MRWDYFSLLFEGIKMDELSSSQAGANQPGSLSSWKLVVLKKKDLKQLKKTALKERLKKIVWNKTISEYLQPLYKLMSQLEQAAVNAKDWC